MTYNNTAIDEHLLCCRLMITWEWSHIPLCVCLKTPIISRDSVRNVLIWRFLLKEEGGEVEDEKEEDYVKSNCGKMLGFEEILHQPLKSVAAACLAVSQNNLFAVTKDFIFCLCSVLLFLLLFLIWLLLIMKKTEPRGSPTVRTISRCSKANWRKTEWWGRAPAASLY